MIADFCVRQRVRLDWELLQHNVMPSKVDKPTPRIHPHINGFGFLTRSGNTLTLPSSLSACLRGLLALVLKRVSVLAAPRYVHDCHVPIARASQGRSCLRELSLVLCALSHPYLSLSV